VYRDLQDLQVRKTLFQVRRKKSSPLHLGQVMPDDMDIMGQILCVKLIFRTSIDGCRKNDKSENLYRQEPDKNEQGMVDILAGFC
jgi:hypothetical protein